jgi:hypothetical protein
MDSPSTSRTFPGFERAFKISDPLADRPYRGRIDTELRWNDEFSFLRAESMPDRPLPIRHAMGEAVPRDFIWTTMATPVVVSQRFIDILLDNRFTGWSTYAVEVYSKAGDLLPGYYGLSITGRCGPIEYEKSQVIYEDMPGGRVPRYKGLYFDPDGWDGSHFFTPSDRGAWKLIVEPVRRALEKAKVRNIRFKRLDETVRPTLT